MKLLVIGTNKRKNKVMVTAGITLPSYLQREQTAENLIFLQPMDDISAAYYKAKLSIFIPIMGVEKALKRVGLPLNTVKPFVIPQDMPLAN
jgi:hypothetical protein